MYKQKKKARLCEERDVHRRTLKIESGRAIYWDIFSDQFDGRCTTALQVKRVTTYKLDINVYIRFSMNRCLLW